MCCTENLYVCTSSLVLFYFILFYFKKTGSVMDKAWPPINLPLKCMSNVSCPLCSEATKNHPVWLLHHSVHQACLQVQLIQGEGTVYKLWNVFWKVSNHTWESISIIFMSNTDWLLLSRQNSTCVFLFSMAWTTLERRHIHCTHHFDKYCVHIVWPFKVHLY